MLICLHLCHWSWWSWYGGAHSVLRDWVKSSCLDLHRFGCLIGFSDLLFEECVLSGSGVFDSVGLGLIVEHRFLQSVSALSGVRLVLTIVRCRIASWTPRGVPIVDEISSLNAERSWYRFTVSLFVCLYLPCRWSDRHWRSYVDLIIIGEIVWFPWKLSDPTVLLLVPSF